MKKWISALLLLLALAVAAIYIFIPSEQQFKVEMDAVAPMKAAQRLITDKQRWEQWCPGKKTDDKNFEFDGFKYHIKAILINGFSAVVSHGEDSLTGMFSFSPADSTGTSFEWNTTLVLPGNPISRVAAYRQAAIFKKNISNLMQAVKKTFDDPKNIYGFKPQVTRLTDEFLITAKQQTNHYPNTEEVYKLVNEVKEYINSKGGTEKNPPMLNVYKLADTVYQVMVAIPTTQQMPGEGKFIFKQMVLGYIAVGEVTGGLFTTAKAEKEMENYVNDFNKTSPAIPYQMLVTDRMKEADTSKWVTRFYYPVYY